MELFLLRHGESEWNALYLFQGHHPSKLTERGKKQAGKVAEWIARKCKPDLLLSSDLRRAVETAHIVAKATNVNPHFTPLLRERSMGSIESQPIGRKNVELIHYVESGKQWIPKDAETLASMKKRARKTTAKISHSKKRCIVVVGHEVFNSALVNTLLKRKLQPVLQNHTQVHWFRIEKGKVKKYRLAVSVK